ncbi:MAG: hypothetical protein L0322_09665 [Chloroflexi bacterium]|nr:hypothetical protein [Chloroflexota bacterium]MCI0575706.1 hypothetical protein [Chloroflexota bacterium]MCI0648048.1 hypothetical protein [Chloroflexota bacterium]
MIDINAAVHRTFFFPTIVSQARNYFRDFRRIVQHLPHISLVQDYGDGRYRVLYSTVELGAYHVHIFADVKSVLDEATNTLHIQPVNGIPIVKPRSGLTRLTAHGRYHSRSEFYEDEYETTRVEYYMELSARLPTPLGLQIMPGLHRVADNITHKRVHEIAEGFVERAIADLPRWLEEQG